jgi:hypothetical protein
VPSAAQPTASSTAARNRRIRAFFIDRVARSTIRSRARRLIYTSCPPMPDHALDCDPHQHESR